MRESRSYGSAGARGGNDPLYPEMLNIVALCKAREMGNYTS